MKSHTMRPFVTDGACDVDRMQPSRNHFVISTRHDGHMTTRDFPVAIAEADPHTASPAESVVTSLVSELEFLLEDSPVHRTELIALHGALLAYEIQGDASLIPVPSLGFGSRRVLTFRVTRAARRLIAESRDAESAIEVAVQVIEDLIHLIDPELRPYAA
jgi:hypothetical protein